MNKERIVTSLKKEGIFVCSMTETFALEVNQGDQALTGESSKQAFDLIEQFDHIDNLKMCIL
jgi:hypothetical protein